MMAAVSLQGLGCSQHRGGFYTAESAQCVDITHTHTHTAVCNHTTHTHTHTLATWDCVQRWRQGYLWDLQIELELRHIHTI